MLSASMFFVIEIEAFTAKALPPDPAGEALQRSPLSLVGLVGEPLRRSPPFAFGVSIFEPVVPRPNFQENWRL